MAAIPQNVLNWLHSVLTSEYHDIPRTFSDVAQALSLYQTFRPRTDVYTFEDGRSSLLLHITGTLPVQFRGATYSFPVSLWVPHGYPREGPIAFVTPTNDMVVRPGQYVSGEGRIYHPYLAGWRADKSNLSDLVRILQEIFSREPPAISKNDQISRPLPHTQTAGISPPLPPVPPKPGRPTSESSGFTQSSDPRSGPAPPPPPKPVQHNYRTQPSHTYGGPPVPPQPSISGVHNRLSSESYPVSVPTSSQTWQRPGHYAPQRSSGLRSDHSQSNQIRPHQTTFERESLHGPPQPPLPSARPQNPPSGPDQASQTQYNAPWQRHQLLPGGNAPQPSQQPIPYNPQDQSQNHHQSLYPLYAPRQPPAAPKPPEDLLSSPFDNPIPSDSQLTTITAPPIPPNPEKDALLSALSQTLTQHLHSAIASNASALPPLRAQRAALQTALQNLQHEHQSLTSLQALLSSNESILHTAMHEADTCIANASHRTVPPVDDVLVAPTVVGEQMYGLVAEERALVEARGVLTRALDRGRVGCEGWVKGVRGLAREEFLKKVLIRKCVRGMGLREGEEWG